MNVYLPASDFEAQIRVVDFFRERETDPKPSHLTAFLKRIANRWFLCPDGQTRKVTRTNTGAYRIWIMDPATPPATPQIVNAPVQEMPVDMPPVSGPDEDVPLPSEAPVNDLEQELTPVLTKAKDQLKQVLSKAKAKRCKICEESGVDSGTHATKDHPRPARARSSPFARNGHDLARSCQEHDHAQDLEYGKRVPDLYL